MHSIRPNEQIQKNDGERSPTLMLLWHLEGSAKLCLCTCVFVVLFMRETKVLRPGLLDPKRLS